MSIINYNFKKPYEKMINEQLDFIEKQSYKIVKLKFADKKTGENAKIEIENRALELSNNVLDKLKKEDFKILRNFNKKAKITTYLTTIISRQFVDIIRKKMGRSREKDRAKEFGDLGLRIYKDVCIDKNSIQEFYKILQFENSIITIEKIEEIVDRIKGKKKYDKKDIENFPDTPVKKGVIGENGEVLVTEKNKTPESYIFANEQKQIIDKNLKLILSKLTTEEKLILKLRFYNDKDDKKDIINGIANLLDINKRAVSKKIDKILKKCKNILNENGIELNDLF